MFYLPKLKCPLLEDGASLKALQSWSFVTSKKWILLAGAIRELPLRVENGVLAESCVLDRSS